MTFHLAGQPVQADTLVVQRCALCGTRLVFEYHPETRNGKARTEIFTPGAIIWSETLPDGDVRHKTVLVSDDPLELPYPDHKPLVLLGGLLCTEINMDEPLKPEEFIDSELGFDADQAFDGLFADELLDDDDDDDWEI